MRVFEGFDRSGEIVRPVATIGSYDGVHAGHREILARLQQTASQRGGESTVITFHPHPRQVLYPGEPLRLLSTLPEKLDLLASLGVDNVIVVPFTEAFSRIAAPDFVRECLVGRLRVDTLIVGYNHHLGRDKAGDSASLQRLGSELGFRVEQMPRQSVDEEKVSSTVVRRQVSEGRMARAARYLGAPYALRGTLCGDAVAGVDPLKLLPSPGSYPVRLETERNVSENVLIVGPDRSLRLHSLPGVAAETPVTVKFI